MKGRGKGREDLHAKVKTESEITKAKKKMHVSSFKPMPSVTEVCRPTTAPSARKSLSLDAFTPGCASNILRIERR